jgi:hypothetical protein
MILHCETLACRNQAVLLIVYGCLECHISDCLFCAPHFSEWEARFKTGTCGRCGGKLAEYITKTLFGVNLPDAHLRPGQPKDPYGNTYPNITWLLNLPTVTS